jgi:hypothetical protein
MFLLKTVPDGAFFVGYQSIHAFSYLCMTWKALPQMFVHVLICSRVLIICHQAYVCVELAVVFLKSMSGFAFELFARLSSYFLFRYLCKLSYK